MTNPSWLNLALMSKWSDTGLRRAMRRDSSRAVRQMAYGVLTNRRRRGVRV